MERVGSLHSYSLKVGWESLWLQDSMMASSVAIFSMPFCGGSINNLQLFIKKDKGRGRCREKNKKTFCLFYLYLYLYLSLRKPVQKIYINLACNKVVVIHYLSVQRNISLHSLYLYLIQCHCHPGYGLCPIVSVYYELGKKRVIMRGHSMAA